MIDRARLATWYPFMGLAHQGPNLLTRLKPISKCFNLSVRLRPIFKRPNLLTRLFLSLDQN